MPTRSWPALVLALLLALLAVPAAGAGGRADSGPALPAPTGPLPVGSTPLHLVDASRPDPWKPGKAYRELMLTVWYPAVAPSHRPAPYMSARLSAATLGTEAVSTVRTNSTLGAVPVPTRWPLVVLSPGFGMTRVSLTAEAEDLASRGYVVAAVDHTYEAAVEFPDGRLEPCLLCGGQGGADVERSRVRDLRFAVDRLTDTRAGLPVDAGRVALVGHALGGSASIDLLADDPRIDAAANLDGTFFTDPRPTSRPVLLMGARWPTAGGTPAPNWVQRWGGLTGWKRWLAAPTAGHLSFSDAHWLYERFDLTHVIPPELAPRMFGDITGERAMEITRAYLGAFADRHLRGRQCALLDRPSSAYPEVGFVHP